MRFKKKNDEIMKQKEDIQLLKTNAQQQEVFIDKYR